MHSSTGQGLNSPWAIFDLISEGVNEPKGWSVKD
jgi:hypothetical protein